MNLRHAAISMAEWLPPEREEALQVLEYLRELIEWRCAEERNPAAPVLRLVQPPPAS